MTPAQQGESSCARLSVALALSYQRISLVGSGEGYDAVHDSSMGCSGLLLHLQGPPRPCGEVPLNLSRAWAWLLMTETVVNVHDIIGGSI